MKKYLFHLLIIGITLSIIQGCEKDGKKEDPFNGTTLNVTTLSQLPSALEETSGIVVSSSDRVWSHGDSGNPNELYLFNSLGTLLKTNNH
ncbi:MAG: hypothetical protein SCK70_09015 [bacterium]|nr:hypothetical protein [bacterium]